MTDLLAFKKCNYRCHDDGNLFTHVGALALHDLYSFDRPLSI